MSSNPNNNNNRPSKNMKSIAHRIVWMISRTKLGLYFKMDFLIFVLLNIFWAYMKELEVIGSFAFKRHRDFIVENGLITDLAYRVRSMDGKVLMTVGFFDVFARIAMLVGALYLLQLLGVLISLPAVSSRAHKTLSPIREVAEKADELNRLAFSEDKYRLIEDAIEHVAPDENQYVYLHDEELLGVEQSVNHLIERLKDSYRQQARFVNDASHELRTPIAVIQGYAQMLERWGTSDEKVLDESISAISHEADHMNRLVEQLLFLARGDSGKTVLSKEPVSLGNLMQEIYEESFMIDETHPYRFRKSEEDVVVDADRMLLKQAVRILVDNAAKYTNPGDEIILGVGMTEDDRPYLMVQDMGIGMSQADVEHMFERFYRADKARTYDGTGLGLSIAKWIVDRHGGHFEVLSRTELGTRIMIVLP
ncbi:sensor histidine kinase [Butyrivibrio sp. X503]|uniref:sensor histidine kinase n=1 Tax=unclassified Butyrivibrio TaxID=2639466 RepID=UPI000EAA57DB|nr:MULTISPECIES: HAMP domain-containing sensor histidine kinase [unclassified Butyrivibrio]RKM54704.1 sensor histidine kinase [Butyrivibrio sp. X503]RKM61728.1 sensor histidine kinase [Butyrivibrio sp. XB500-5]